MSTVIQIKRSTGTTAPSQLYHGELAYTSGSGSEKLYIGAGGVAGDGYANREDIIGGKYFTDYLDHTPGSLAASSAILVDSNLAIDSLNIGNNASTGGTLKLNEGTNNGTSFVGLKAPNTLASSTTYTFPTAYGTAGQFLKTDGASGNLIWDTVNQFITLDGDANGPDTYNTAETLTFTGGTGIDTSIGDNEITFNITNSGVDTAQIADDAVTNAKLDTNGELTLGSTGLQLGQTTTDIAGLTSLVVDDLTINGQTIATTASNKDIALSPNGTGTVTVPSGYDQRAGFVADSLVPKSYVDAIAEGLHVHEAAAVATTQDLATESGDTVTYDNGTLGVGATLTLSTGISTIDGYTLQNGDSVLIKDEATAAHNGIYIRTSATVFTRRDDFNTTEEIASGDFLYVTNGTLGGGNGYVQTEITTTIGTSAINFEQFSGAGQIIDGDAIVKSGNRLDVQVDDSSIEITADALNVKALGVTNAMLAGSIATSKLADTRIYFTDETSTQGVVRLNETLEFLTGEAVNTVASGRTLRITVDNASTSAKGIASFSSDNFTVTSGDVTVSTIDGGTY